jgi:hypothetical protein
MGTMLSRRKPEAVVAEDREEEHTIDAMEENSKRDMEAQLALDQEIEAEANKRLEKLGRLADTAAQIEARNDTDSWAMRGETLDKRLRFSNIHNRPLSPRHGMARETLAPVEALGMANKQKARRLVFQKIWQAHTLWERVKTPSERHEKRHRILELIAMHVCACRADLQTTSSHHAMDNAMSEEWASMTTLHEYAEYCLDPADIRSYEGGSTLTPQIATFSYPGKTRNQLYYVLRQLGIDLDREVHVMNATDKLGGNQPMSLEQLPMYEQFKELGGWSRIIWQCEKAVELGGLGMDEGFAPAWFVRQWAPAAIWSAEHGLGVVLLSTWGGADSANMELEHIFCEECVEIYFPGSVCFG